MVDTQTSPPKPGEDVLPETVYVAHGLLRAEVVRIRLESEGIPAILQYLLARQLITTSARSRPWAT